MSYVLKTAMGLDSVLEFTYRHNYGIDTDRATGLQLIRTGLLAGRKEVLTHWCIPAK